MPRLSGAHTAPAGRSLYGTTPDFLKHFGLNEISDLPKPREIEELLGETELEVEKRMLANQEELEFKEKLHEKLDPNSRAPHIPEKNRNCRNRSKKAKAKTVIEKMIPVLPSSRIPEKDDDEPVENEEVASNSPSNETTACRMS